MLLLAFYQHVASSFAVEQSTELLESLPLLISSKR